MARVSSKDTLRQTLLWWGPLGLFRISCKHARARPCVRPHACPHTRKPACENDPRPRGPPTSARSHARNLSDCVSPSHASHLRLPRTSARGLSCLPARSHALRNAPSVARLLYRPVTRQRRTHRCRATPGQNSRDSRAVVFASPAARTFTTNQTFPTTLADPGAKATNLAARTRQHCPTVECASPPSRSAFGRTPQCAPLEAAVRCKAGSSHAASSNENLRFSPVAKIQFAGQALLQRSLGKAAAKTGNATVGRSARRRTQSLAVPSMPRPAEHGE